MMFSDFVKPLDIKQIKKNFRNLLKEDKKIKDVDRSYPIYTEDEFYYYMKDLFKSEYSLKYKKEYFEMKNKFTTLKYEAKNDCLKLHNRILDEIEKYKVFKNTFLKFKEDLTAYYYDHFNYPKYLKALEEVNKKESYDLLYSSKFLNEKELRNILFQFYL
jgi:hypothetical protein